MPTLYVAITNHGFGHTTRTASVIAELQHQRDDISVIISTTAPAWLLESYISQPFIYRSQAFDIGVVQADSLQIDREATLSKLRELQSQSAALIAEEVDFLRNHKVDLILADVPPLITSIAKLANIPCWMASNFGWDFIYRDWGGEFIEIADWISELYGDCDRLFRLPFHEPMSSFQTAHSQNAVIDVGFTGGSPKFLAEQLRSQLQLSRDRPTVLLTFGGLSLNQIPYHNLAKFPDWQFITFDTNAPDLPNLTRITSHNLRPVDLMVICDRIVSKPGYTTLSEACRLNVPIVCLTRDGFIEAESLIKGLKNYAQHLIISPKEFYEGDWQFLTDRLEVPQSQEKIDTYGEVEIAKEIADYMNSLN